MEKISITLDPEDMAALLAEIRKLSHGGVKAPMGMEAITMALVGKGVPGAPGDNNIARGLWRIADSIDRLTVEIAKHRTPSLEEELFP